MHIKNKKDVVFYFLLIVLLAAVFGLNYWNESRFPLLHSRSFATGNEFDVIVVGGEPEGVAAAVAASRSEAKVLLVDERPDVGGLLTFGMLNSLDMNYGLRHRLVTKGIFYEFYRQIEGSSFDVKVAQKVLHDMVKNEPNITFWPKAKFVRAIVNSRHEIVGIEVIKDGQLRQIIAPRTIDATQDADVAASAGVPFMNGGADRGYANRFMASTLVFGLRGVNWDEVRSLLRHDGDPLTGADRVSAWGFLDTMKKYKPVSARIRMRGLNLGRQKDGTVLVNALLIFDVNGTNPQSKANAIHVAKAELPHIVDYIRKHIPCFANAKLSVVAPELYIRETRHIIGEYRLTANDVLENRDFWDRIAIGAYPIDIQAMDSYNLGQIVGRPVQYAIPFRCLVPLKIENLLVVGRSASYWSVAMGSARVVPVGMCEGEAAGVAAAYSIWKEMTFRAISKDRQAIADIQDILKQRGAYLEQFKIFNPNTLHWSYPALRVLLPTGVVQGRYSNNYRFENAITEKQFFSLAASMERVLFGYKTFTSLVKKYEKNTSNNTLTPDEAAYWLLVMNGNADEAQKNPHRLLLAKQKGLITPLAIAHGFGGKKVTFAHAYELLANLYRKQYPKASNVYAPPPENTKEKTL